MTGKSNWSSSAPNSINNSNTSSTTCSGRADGLSILFTTTIGTKCCSNAFFKTKRVCGIVPSYASTTKTTPSTIFMIRSTSPPKSACPGVSMMLIFVPLYSTAVFFAKIVIPRSFSIAFESIARSCNWVWLSNVWDCFNNSSTNVVFPWSTWAIIATLRISFLIFNL